MDELILRHLAGRATDLEARRLERWYAESAENRRRVDELRAVWVATGTDGGSGSPSGEPPPLDWIVATAEGRRRKAEGAERRRTIVRSPWLVLLGTAAAAAVVVVASPGDAPREPDVRLRAVETATGSSDVTTMSLSDGSVIRLASASAVEFPVVAGVRAVDLSGRAFFAVRPDTLPFVVRTAAGEVTVRGTRFELFEDPGGLRVIVVEGRVAAEGHGGSVLIVAGQVARIGTDGVPMVESNVDVWSLLDWEGGLLVFSETPLGQVVAELQRRFGVPVSLADPSLAGRRITAWFGDDSLDEVAEAICLVAGVSCETRGGGVRLGR